MSDSSRTADPGVSVVIPMFQEARYIESCLQCMLDQDYSKIVEILCVDGGSSDGSKEIVTRLQHSDARIKLLENPHRVQAAALNIGIGAANGDIIARIDAHGGYAPDYISRCVNCLLSTGAGNVGGPAKPVHNGTHVSKLIVFAHLSRFGIGVAKFRRDAEGWVDTVWPGFFWKKLFDEVGLYRLDLPRSEDNDMNERIRRHGHGIYLSPAIHATYFPRSDLLSLAKKCLSDGEGVAVTLASNRRAVEFRHFVPLMFVLWLIVSLLLLPVSGLGAIGLGLALVPYLIGCVIFSIPIAVHHGIRYAIAMPALFLLIHLAYGLGTLRGLVLAGLTCLKRAR